MKEVTLFGVTSTMANQWKITHNVITMPDVDMI
jgi:hypothetical protein